MKSWNSSVNVLFLALARSTQALPRTLRRCAMPRSWRSRSSIGRSVLLEEIEHGLGEGLRLLDIGDVRGVERDKSGAGNGLGDCFAGGRRSRRILRADDHQGRRPDRRIAGAEVDIAYRG